jgi:hypothetical protein
MLKMKIQLTCFFLMVITFACTNVISNKVQQTKKKRQTVDWMDQNSCLDNLDKYKVNSENWEYIKLYFYKNKNNKLIYYLTCSDGSGPAFHQLLYNIDFDTFLDFGSYALDKDSVYYSFLMSDGLKIIKLNEADRQTFETFGNTMYAKDKNNVYYSRHGIFENADLETFEPLYFKSNESIPPLARDKYHIYIWDEILQDTIQIEGLKEFLVH